MEEGRSGFKISTGKPRGKRLLGRPWHQYEELDWIWLTIGIIGEAL
jgi:hypothetical protein